MVLEPPLRRSKYNVKRVQRTCHCWGYWFPHRWQCKWCMGNPAVLTLDPAERPTGRRR